MSARIIKVLQVGKFYPPHMGGIETHLETLCGGLRSTGSVQVDVLVAGRERVSKSQTAVGIPVFRAGTWLTVASTPICPAMISRIRNSEADVIHLHLPNPMAVLAYLASGHRGRLVITYHSDTVRQRVLGALFEPMLQQSLGSAAAIIVTSPNYLKTSRTLSRHVQRCHVIPYGIHVPAFQLGEEATVTQLRRQYGSRIILAVGRLVYYKGFEYLIEAMKNVNGKLLIAGDGPLRSKLQAQVDALGLTERVVLLGNIPNDRLPPYYQAAEVFALPSIARSEAFAIVQIEAMAAGKPVVNTALDSGVPFVSLHGISGLTVPARDSSALASALNLLLDDEALRASYGEAGRIRARDVFAVDRMVSDTLQVYDRVLARQNVTATEVVI